MWVMGGGGGRMFRCMHVVCSNVGYWGEGELFFNLKA